MHKVAILLATYDPGPYIKELVASIASQSYKDFKIYWGDDGSDESQLLMIRELLESFTFEEFHFKRIGATQNFLQLLKQTSEEYIAFCDQDDVWLVDKLEIQIRALENLQSIPSLSHSPVQIIRDGNLGRVVDLCQDHSISKLMGENCCRGCTMMINQSAKMRILEINSEFVTWHDWLAISVVSSIGHVHKSELPLVNYRLHSKNSIGIPNYFRRVLNYFIREKGLVLSQFEIIHRELHIDLGDVVLEDYERFFNLFRGKCLNRLKNMILDSQRRKSPIIDFFRKIVWSFKTP